MKKGPFNCGNYAANCVGFRIIIRSATLFTNLEFRDRKPSQLFRNMEQLLESSKIDDSLLRLLWMQKLPSSTKHVLAPFKENASIAELTEAVNRIFDDNNKSTLLLRSRLQCLRLHLQTQGTPNISGRCCYCCTYCKRTAHSTALRSWSFCT